MGIVFPLMTVFNNHNLICRFPSNDLQFFMTATKCLRIYSFVGQGSCESFPSHSSQSDRQKQQPSEEVVNLGDAVSLLTVSDVYLIC